MTMNTKVDSIKQLVGFGMLVLKACQVIPSCRRIEQMTKIPKTSSVP